MEYKVEYYIMPFGSNAWQKFASIRISAVNKSDVDKFTSRLIKDGAGVYETDVSIVYHIYPEPRHMAKFIFYK